MATPTSKKGLGRHKSTPVLTGRSEGTLNPENSSITSRRRLSSRYESRRDDSLLLVTPNRSAFVGADDSSQSEDGDQFFLDDWDGRVGDYSYHTVFSDDGESVCDSQVDSLLSVHAPRQPMRPHKVQSTETVTEAKSQQEIPRLGVVPHKLPHGNEYLSSHVPILSTHQEVSSIPQNIPDPRIEDGDTHSQNKMTQNLQGLPNTQVCVENVPLPSSSQPENTQTYPDEQSEKVANPQPSNAVQEPAKGTEPYTDVATESAEVAQSNSTDPGEGDVHAVISPAPESTTETEAEKHTEQRHGAENSEITGSEATGTITLDAPENTDIKPDAVEPFEPVEAIEVSQHTSENSASKKLSEPDTETVETTDLETENTEPKVDSVQPTSGFGSSEQPNSDISGQDELTQGVPETSEVKSPIEHEQPTETPRNSAENDEPGQPAENAEQDAPEIANGNMESGSSQISRSDDESCQVDLEFTKPPVSEEQNMPWFYQHLRIFMRMLNIFCTRYGFPMNNVLQLLSRKVHLQDMYVLCILSNVAIARRGHWGENGENDISWNIVNWWARTTLRAYQFKVADMEGQLVAKDKTISTLQGENATLKELQSSLQTVTLKLSRGMHGLHTRTKSFVSTSKQLSDRFKKTEQSLLSQLSSSHDEVTRLKQEVEKYKSRELKTEKEVQDQHQSLRCQISTSEQALSVCQRDLALCNDKLKSSEKTLSSCQQDLMASQAELKNTSEKLSACEAKFGETKGQLDEEREKIVILNSMELELEQTKAELENSKVELDMSKTELSKCQGDLEKTKTELSACQQDLSDVNGKLERSAVRVSRLTQDVTRTRSNLSSTQRELTQSQEELEKADEELELYQQQLEQYKEQMSQSQTQSLKSREYLKTIQANANERVTRYQKQRTQAVADLQLANEKLANSNNELATVKNELTKTQAQLRNACDELTTAKTESPGLRDELRRSKVELTRVQAQLKTAKDAVANAETQSTIANSKVSLLESEHHAKIEKLKSELKNIQKKLEMSQETESDLRSKLLDAKEQLSSSQDSVIRANQELASSKRSEVRLQEKVDSLRTKESVLQDKLSQSTYSSSSLSDTHLELKVARLEVKISTLERSVKQADLLREDLEEQIRDLESKNRRLERSRSSYDGRGRRHGDSYDSYDNSREIRRLKRELSDKEDEISKLERRLRDEKDKRRDIYRSEDFESPKKYRRRYDDDFDINRHNHSPELVALAREKIEQFLAQQNARKYKGYAYDNDYERLQLYLIENMTVENLRRVLTMLTRRLDEPVTEIPTIIDGLMSNKEVVEKSQLFIDDVVRYLNNDPLGPGIGLKPGSLQWGQRLNSEMHRLKHVMFKAHTGRNLRC